MVFPTFACLAGVSVGMSFECSDIWVMAGTPRALRQFFAGSIFLVFRDFIPLFSICLFDGSVMRILWCCSHPVVVSIQQCRILTDSTTHNEQKSKNNSVIVSLRAVADFSVTRHQVNDVLCHYHPYLFTSRVVSNSPDAYLPIQLSFPYWDTRQCQ